MHNKKYFRSLACIIIAVCILVSTGFSMEPNDPNKMLEEKLKKVAAKNKGETADLSIIESECLALIKDYNSPAQKGEIYAKIADIYSGKGFSSRQDARVSKVRNYCMKALEYPLNPITTCEIYRKLADSLMVGYWDLPQSEFIQLRREAAAYCLKGLKISADNKAPEEYLPPPVVGRYNVVPRAPDYEKLMKRQQEEIAARKKWEFDNKLFNIRKALTQQCVSLYSQKPYDTGEIERLANKILAGYSDAVETLLNKIRTEITRKQFSNNQ